MQRSAKREVRQLTVFCGVSISEALAVDAMAARAQRSGGHMAGSVLASFLPRTNRMGAEAQALGRSSTENFKQGVCDGLILEFVIAGQPGVDIQQATQSLQSDALKVEQQAKVRLIAKHRYVAGARAGHWVREALA